MVIDANHANHALSLPLEIDNKRIVFKDGEHAHPIRHS